MSTEEEKWEAAIHSLKVLRDRLIKKESQLAEAREVIRKVEKHLDRTASIPCEASVYSLDDDEFGTLMFLRDIASEFLEKHGGNNG